MGHFKPHETAVKKNPNRISKKILQDYFINCKLFLIIMNNNSQMPIVYVKTFNTLEHNYKMIDYVIYKNKLYFDILTLKTLKHLGSIKIKKSLSWLINNDCVYFKIAGKLTKFDFIDDINDVINNLDGKMLFNHLCQKARKEYDIELDKQEDLLLRRIDEANAIKIKNREERKLLKKK